MPQRLTQEQFEQKVHALSPLISLSNFNYISHSHRGWATCLKHGDWEITANHLLRGRGCPKCKFEYVANLQRSSIPDFVAKAILKHGDTYDYSEIIEYSNNKTPVPIKCHLHGPFLCRPDAHLRGRGCPVCNRPGLEHKLSKLKSNPDIYSRIYGSVYVLKVVRLIDGFEFVKIGITTSDVKFRYQRSDYDGYRIEIENVQYMHIDKAKLIESKLKSEFADSRVDGFNCSGKTECFNMNRLHEILNQLQSLHAEMHVEKSI